MKQQAESSMNYMAGRIRTIKPEFLDDERIGERPPITRLLFVALWLLSDDYGNLRANPKFIRSQVFAYDESTTLTDVSMSLDDLERLGMVQRYSVREQDYLHITNWSKHQRVDKPGKPLCPLPNIDVGAIREGAENIPETPAPDHDHDHDHEMDQDQGSRPKSKRPRKRSPAPEVPLPDDWAPTPTHVAFAQKHNLDLELETAKFKGHFDGQLLKSWNGRFATWLANAVEYKRRNGSYSAQPAPVSPTGEPLVDALGNRKKPGQVFKNGHFIYPLGAEIK